MKANTFTAESAMEMLCKMRTPHVVKQCNSSTSIKIDGGRSYFFPSSGETIDAKYLKFITDTKNEVCANARELNLREVSPKFIQFSPLFNDGFRYGFCEFSEIDINSAYWLCARAFGLITETTYLQGIDVPKKVRLMALGAAAATKDVFEFDGKDYEHIGLEYDHAGRMAFFNVAKRVDDAMVEALQLFHGAAIFYWVDALFVRTEFAESVRYYLLEWGFETKIYPLAWVYGNATRKTIETMKITSETEDFTEFERKIYFKPKSRKKIAEKKVQKTR